MRNITRWALAPLAVLALGACGDRDAGADATGAETAAVAPSSKTLAASLPGGGPFAGAVGNSGLAAVLEGVGPYTVFAPADSAFSGDAADLADKANSAQAAALLRAHIVPGALTRADIAAALDRAGSGGKVEMRSMADTLLTFSRDGGAIVVTAVDGTSARLSGSETLASNGVIQPVDGLLVKPAAPAA